MYILWGVRAYSSFPPPATNTLTLTHQGAIYRIMAPQQHAAEFQYYLYKNVEVAFAKWRRTTFEVGSSESPSLPLTTPVLRPAAIHFLMITSKLISWSSGMS